MKRTHTCPNMTLERKPLRFSVFGTVPPAQPSLRWLGSTSGGCRSVQVNGLAGWTTFTTEHPMASQSSSFEPKDSTTAVLICSTFVLALILAPFVFAPPLLSRHQRHRRRAETVSTALVVFLHGELIGVCAQRCKCVASRSGVRKERPERFRRVPTRGGSSP